MNRAINTILLLCSFTIHNCQNIIPNGGFETHLTCPWQYGQIDLATPWMNPANLSSQASPDYFHRCNDALLGVPHNFAGYQEAHSGDAYSGILIYSYPQNYREYIEVPLTQSLIENICYHFEMYVSLGDGPFCCRYSTDDFGAFFSSTAITNLSSISPLSFIPQIINSTENYPDTLTWKLSSGDFIASGKEKYLIIGNFLDDAHSDTIIASSGSTFRRVYLFIDDIKLTPCIANGLEGINGEILKLFPSPFTNQINIVVNGENKTEFILYDLTAMIIIQREFTNDISVNTDQLKPGLYFYETRRNNVVISRGKLPKE